MPDIITSKTFVDGEKGITAAKLNQIISGAVIQPAFYSAKPSSATLDPTDVLLELKGTGAYAQITGTQLASSVAGQLPVADATQNGMMRQVSGLTTDVVDGTNHCVPFTSFAGITQMRLRSFNAIGNPTFEVDQRNAGQTSSLGTGRFVLDRWFGQSGGISASGGQTQASGSDILVPGTNFKISNRFARITLTAQKTSLAATDNLSLYQLVEGPSFRELSNDVHSVSLLVRSSVAGSFGLTLRDSALTFSLCKLCTIPSPNTWTLIQLPNLPLWSASGTFPSSPGALSYLLTIGLALGSSGIPSSNDAWISGNYAGALGQSNFAASPLNSTFDIAYAGHEPGAVSTTLQDCPFGQNLDGCLRYFQKTYQYGVLPGTVTQNGMKSWLAFSGGVTAHGPHSFLKIMAKIPTVTFYNYATGAANSVRDGASGDHASAAAGVTGDSGFGYVQFAGAVGSNTQIYGHYTADTLW